MLASLAAGQATETQTRSFSGTLTVSQSSRSFTSVGDANP
jgi:hypothetical protein